MIYQDKQDEIDDILEILVDLIPSPALASIDFEKLRDKLNGLAKPSSAVTDSMWTMNLELERVADNNNCVLLKRWVKGWYTQLGEIHGKEFLPVWESRELK